MAPLAVRRSRYRQNYAHQRHFVIGWRKKTKPRTKSQCHSHPLCIFRSTRSNSAPHCPGPPTRKRVTTIMDPHDHHSDWGVSTLLSQYHFISTIWTNTFGRGNGLRFAHRNSSFSAVPSLKSVLNSEGSILLNNLATMSKWLGKG